MARHFHIIGVAGGSASGKTSFLRDLVDMLPKGGVSIISQDNYYHPKEMQFVDENGEINFDLPTSIDREQFHKDLVELSSGKSITKKEYTFNNKSGAAFADSSRESPPGRRAQINSTSSA